jgi:hypothetical protein
VVELDCAGAKDVTDATFRRIARLTRLRALSLAYCPLLDDQVPSPSCD